MPRPELLSDEDLQIRLKEVPDWEPQDKTIVRELHASNFVSAVGVISAIAILAETLDHHPDILLYGWNKLKITLSTHDRGGLTELDLELAKKIDELNF